MKELLALKAHPEERKAELEKGLNWSLNTVMAAVERGVTVEIRFLPPPPKADGGDDGDDGEAIFKALQQTNQNLAFPAPSQTPLLELPSPEAPAATAE